MNSARKANLVLLAIAAEGLLSRLSFGIIGFALPLYARQLGFSMTEIGVLVALNSAVSVALKPVLGWTGDRFGVRRTLLAAIGLRSAVSLLLGFAATPLQLFGIRTVHGVSMSLRDPAANVLLAENGGEKRVASAFAWYQTARGVANSLSKAFAGIVLTLTAANYPLMFFIAFGISTLPLAVVALFIPESRSSASAQPAPETPVRPRQRASVLPFVGFGFLVAATAEMLSGLFPVIATEYAGLSKAQAGLIYAFTTIVAIVSGPVFGWLSDNVSRKLVLAVRSVTNIFSSVLYLVSPTFIGMGLAKSADDMGKAAFRPAWGSLMAHVSGQERKTRVQTMSWLSMGEDAGGVAAPIMAGLLWSAWGIAALMAVRIVLAIATEIYAVTVTRSFSSPEEAPPTALLERARG